MDDIYLYLQGENEDMNTVDFSNVGFIYRFWYNVFIKIEYFLPFSIFRKFIFRKTEAFSDKWVVANTGLSFISLLVSHYFEENLFIKILLLYGALRIFEIIIYQINVLLFHPYKALFVDKKLEYRIQNPYRSVVLLGHNFLEVIFWFTVTTNVFQENNTRLILNLMDNTIRIFTFNYEKVSTGASILQLICFVEVICGILLTVISLAKFIGELPHIHITYTSMKESDNESNEK